ncbi:hypothetical protein P5G50_17380 [Leifsonia sp. F6_8S_P_1B]|uniref:Transcriptional regulator, AbiEi antitoxin, Type IV TA system n=1 Tax=Leifsonia williamsii TaxID=3035919 RepID=A0ABT8KFK4_9MICO|nr:hypothetical protein [Leifsonia williamsii]MDN4616224.1 hypothetical protein [Leifsonia williamsii]
MTDSRVHAVRSASIHDHAVHPQREATRRHLARRHARDDHLERLRGFASTRRVPPVFCHWSAAVIHGLPLLLDPPRSIHVLSANERAGADRGVVRLPRLGDPEVVCVRGLQVTSAARTVMDLAARTSYSGGVVAADFALSAGAFGSRRPLADREELLREAVWVEPSGASRAEAAARFADGRAESPLESVSRVTLALAGAPPPELQVPVGDLLGWEARVDFCWPQLGLIGEADGAEKLLDPAMLRDRSMIDAVADRRVREERLERAGFRVMRWGWDAGRDLHRMRELLAAHGVPLEAGDGVRLEAG